MEDTRISRLSKSAKQGHIIWQRLKQHAQSLHRSVPGSLCIYYRFNLIIFMELLHVRMSEYPILMPTLWALFFFLLNCLVKLKNEVHCFFFSYFIFSGLVVISLNHETFLSFLRDKNGVDLEGNKVERTWEE